MSATKQKARGAKPCDVHNEPKDFFCLAPECMLDLCASCLHFHEEMHAEQDGDPQIEHLPRILAVAQEKLARMVWAHEGEIKRLERGRGVREQEWDDAVSEIKGNISKAKRVVESVVEEFFAETQEQLLRQYIFPAKKTAVGALEGPLNQLRFKLEKLQAAQKSLERGNAEEIVRYIFDKERGFSAEGLAQRVEGLLTREGRPAPDPSNVKIHFEREQLPALYTALQSFVSVNVSLKELLSDSASERGREGEEVSRGPPRTPSKRSAAPVADELQRLSRLRFELLDTFAPDAFSKLLSFFEPKTRNFHFVDFAELESRFLAAAGSGRAFAAEFAVAELEIDFVLPRHHRSLITREGLTYLTGGLEEAADHAVTLFRACYLLDYESCQLRPIDGFVHPRAAHSVLEVPGGILAVGGISAECAVTDTCELFSFETGTWAALGKLAQPAMNAALCLFGEGHVLKLGGKAHEVTLSATVESLDLASGGWRPVQLPPGFPKLPVSACATQIGPTQVLLFGGSFENHSQKNERVLVLEFAGPERITAVFEAPLRLPSPEGFWNQQVFASGGLLLALQNLPSATAPGVVRMDGRRLLGLTAERVLAFN